MKRALTRRSVSRRFKLLARASTVALIAAAACAQVALAKPPETHGATNNGSGGVGRNPNDLKDGVIDGNAGGPHAALPATPCARGPGADIVGLVNITNATPMPLTGKIECVTVNTTVEHDVVSEAIVGDPGAGHAPFFVGTNGVITGTLWNKGTITGGYGSLTGSGLGALTILGDVQNGVHNSGLITSSGNNGIQLGSSSAIVLIPGTIEGGITNDGTIIALNDGIAMIAGSLSGGLANNAGALVTGGNAAVYIADSFDTWSGGISNAGTLHGNGVGILIGAPGATNVEFAGGIFNGTTGIISSGSGPAIFASGASYAGGLENWGLITETGEEFADVYGGAGVIFDALAVGGDIENHGTIAGVYRQGLLITNNVGLFDGSIDNSGEIDGAAGGVVVLAQTVNGNFVNSGIIAGGANTGVAYFNNTIEGIGGEGATATFTNTGSIIGAAGLVIDAQTVRANVVNGDPETGAGTIIGDTSAGMILAAQNWTGNITNHGFVSGATVGMAVGYDPFFGKAPPNNALTGNVVNNGSIHGDAAGVIIAIDNFTGDFTNNGSITGGQYGVALEGRGNFEGSAFFAASCIECLQPFSLGGGTFTGNVTNNDFMSGDTALVVSYDHFNGNLTNAAAGTLLGTNYGLLLDVDDFQGNLSNNGTIVAVGEDSTGVALQIGTGSSEGGTVFGSQSFSGDISNTGFIHGQNTGIGLVLDAYTGGTNGFTNSGTITGDVWSGVYIRANQWTGDFTNASAGRIVGGKTGVYIGAAAIDGDFTNDGYIGGGVTGVFINAGTIGGDFTNNGTIVGSEYGVSLGGGTFTGNVTNNDFMSGDTALFVSYDHFTGNLTNAAAGALSGANYGLLLDVDDFQGDLSNDGTIVAGGEGAFGVALQIGTGSTESGTVVGSQSLSGDISNAGIIHGQNTGLGLVLDTYTGGTNGFTNSGTITGDNWTGVYLRANQWTGDFTNASAGRIVGGNTGVYIGAGAIAGDFTNDGYIEGGATGVFINAASITGDFTNNGTIVGSQYGVALKGPGSFENSCIECFQTFSLGGGTFTGNVTNNDFMSGDTALVVSYDHFNGNLSNAAAGTLLGTNHGLLLDVDDFQGNLSNNGTIVAVGEDSTGVALQIGTGSSEGGTVFGSQSFSGDISNTGFIHGQNTGIGLVLDAYTGGTNGFTNSGTITGDVWSGVYIRANQWTGDFTNASAGRIVGGNTGVYIGAGSIDGDFTNDGYIEGGVTGVFINAGTITGDFANNGTIVGNGFDTGWNISAASYTGNIVNGTGGLLTAPSNALHLRIDAFSGEISNEGVIAAPSGNAVAIEGYNTTGIYSGAFTNTGTISASGIGINLSGAQLTGGIVNDGGTISGSTAISTYGATGATTITNTGGGIILGDLRFANGFADTFIAEDGGIVGQIIGEGSNDDSVIVENGTHYFIGKASNLASFTVDDGGFAIMGAIAEGDANGAGYSLSDVSAINVNDGGTLYIDRTASLSAASYTQQSGGTLEFYLGAPGGANFGDLTGTQAAVAGTDYGQIHLSGAANLDGTIAGFFDPAFATANPALDAVAYNDVLVADGGINGDFGTLAFITNSDLFELNEVIDGNTVDLTVTRASLGQLGDIGTVVVETGGPWKSMVNDRSNGIGSGSCSLAGSGWCLNAYAANDAGGSAVMTDATPGADPFGWLRTGARHEGETAIWGRGVGVWGDTSGDATHSATDFDSYGAIVGVDHAFTPIFLAGAAAQWTKSNIDFDGSPDNAHITSVEVGGYVSYGDARFYVNANTSVIFHSIDVTRFAPGGSAHGDYDGTTVSGYAEAGRIFETFEGLRIQPLAALSYAHLGTDAYNETGTATTLLHIFDAEVDSLKTMLGARLAYPIALESGRKLVPEARAIWSHELLDDHSAFDANPISNPLNVATVTGQTYNRDSIIIGAGMTAPLSEATTLFLDYDAALNENITSHTVSGGFRARW